MPYANYIYSCIDKRKKISYDIEFISDPLPFDLLYLRCIGDGLMKEEVLTSFSCNTSVAELFGFPTRKLSS